MVATRTVSEAQHRVDFCDRIMHQRCKRGSGGRPLRKGGVAADASISDTNQVIRSDLFAQQPTRTDAR